MATEQTAEVGRRNVLEGGGTRASRDGRGSEKLATALGWFSIGLGMTEIVAPRTLAKVIGIPERPLLTRLMGLREVAAGVGILKRPRQAGWLWARVGGDILDLAALGAATGSRRSKSERVAAAAAAVAGVTAIDVLCARQLSTGGRPVSLGATVAINRPVEECYRFWHDIENLPRFLTHLKSVRIAGERQSHWIARAPGGRTFSWSAEVTDDAPNQRIAWRSLEGADIPNSGWVEFEPIRRGKGTIVRVSMRYEPPLRAGGPLLTAVLGPDPGMQVRKDLLRLKQLLETGEIATTEGQPAGRPSGATWLDRLART
ncbi:MAG TPA: SRPBCC family protein [Bryobacteraceae bacterium]|nr:SRPBCC family protein [Bryobacteraceae bacterium]